MDDLESVKDTRTEVVEIAPLSLAGLATWQTSTLPIQPLCGIGNARPWIPFAATAQILTSSPPISTRSPACLPSAIFFWTPQPGPV
jgi:hypothetical protein